MNQEISNILESLAQDTDYYKKDALDQALRHQSELTPALLDILKSAGQRPKKFIESGDDSLAYAALLLAYWQEPLAFPLLVKFAYVNEDTLDALWGDMVTQDFQTFLYRTGKQDIQVLKKLANDPEAYLYIRSAALGALNWCVANGLYSRQELNSFYESIFTDPINEKDQEILGLILIEWLHIHPIEYLSLIESSFHKNKLNKMDVGTFEEMNTDLQTKNWDNCLINLKSEMQKGMPEYIHDYTSWWGIHSTSPFESLMVRLGIEMQYHELRAFLLGYILGLEYVPPSQVLSTILIDDFGKEIIFENDAQAIKFHNLFLTLWNELVDWPNEAAPPILSSDISKRSDEIQFFLTALSNTNTNLIVIQDQKAKDAFVWLENYSKKLDLFCKENHIDPEHYFLSMRSLVDEGNLHWPKYYIDLKSGLKAQRVLALQNLAPSVNSVSKIGRNDFCPCGSGRKYKKCCLQ